MKSKSIDKSQRSDKLLITRRVPRDNTSSSRRPTAAKSLSHKRDAQLAHQVQGRDTKHARLLNLLSAPQGASIEEMMLASGWQQHSVRGFLAGTVKKKMGLALTSTKAEGEVRRYSIAMRRGR